MRLRALLLACMTLLLPLTARAQQTDARWALAQADSLFKAGDFANARVAYRQVIQLDSTASRAYYQLARLQPAGSHEQLQLLWRYTELEPGDAWGFGALGEALANAGEVEGARRAYRSALELEPDEEFREALRRLGPTPRARRPSVTIEPIVRRTGDSDGEKGVRNGAALTLTLPPAVRIGIEAASLSVSDGYEQTNGWQAAVNGELRPTRPLTLGAALGLTSIERTAGNTTEPTLMGRVRWRPASGPAFDVRARREPLMATPQLLRTPVVLSEVRASVELPVYSILYARGLGRFGSLDDGSDQNSRRMLGFGPVLRVTPLLEVNALVGRTTYDHPTTAGYFAPERIDVRDAGVYWEAESWPFTLALDAGGGMERIQRFTEPAGEWRPAYHFWSQAGWSLTRAAELRLEAEYYKTQAGETVASGGEGWSWHSIALGVRVRR